MITALYRLMHLLGTWRPSRGPDRTRPADAGTTAVSRRRRPRPSNAVRHLRAVSSDAGMTTAEYAVGTVAAVAFAVVLFKVVQSPAVHTALASVVTSALHVKM